MDVHDTKNTDHAQVIRELAELLDLDVDQVTLDATLKEDLGLDSLQFVTCLSWLESFGVIVDDPMVALKTVGDLLDLLTECRDRDILLPVDLSTVQAADDDLQPVLANRMYRLRPIVQGDTNFLYELATNPESGYRWRYRGNVPPVERFAAELWQQGVLAQFVVTETTSGMPRGLVVCYQADILQGHAYVAAVFSHEAIRGGSPVLAVALFIEYLFKIHPMRKLYMEVPGWNMSQISSGLGTYFHEEARLRKHEYYSGKYWDKHVLAVYRNDGVPNF